MVKGSGMIEIGQNQAREIAKEMLENRYPVEFREEIPGFPRILAFGAGIVDGYLLPKAGDTYTFMGNPHSNPWSPDLCVNRVGKFAAMATGKEWMVSNAATRGKPVESLLSTEAAQDERWLNIDPTPHHATHVHISTSGEIIDVPDRAGDISSNRDDGKYIFFEKNFDNGTCFLDELFEKWDLSQANSSKSLNATSKKVWLTITGFGPIECALLLMNFDEELNKVVDNVKTVVKRVHEISEYVAVVSPTLSQDVANICPNYGRYMDKLDELVRDVNDQGKEKKETVFHLPLERYRKKNGEWNEAVFNFQNGKDPHPNKEGNKYIAREIMAKLVQLGAIWKETK